MSSALKSKYILPEDKYGTLFFNWLYTNYKKYRAKPPEKNTKDICNEDTQKKNEAIKFRRQQEFIAHFLNYNSPFMNILLYHGLGSGKTCTSLNIINKLFDDYSKWNIYILIKASLKNTPWLYDMDKCLIGENKQDKINSIHFIHYDAPNADTIFDRTLNETKDKKKFSIFIIDEVHNFIRNVYSNINSLKSGRALRMYNRIIEEKKSNSYTRLICVSATPVINAPFELGLLFNLLRDNIFPNTEEEFNSLFVEKGKNNTLRKETMNLFQRRIVGLISYYESINPLHYF